MTKAALVKKADLKRMADLAKHENVTVWVEVEGKKIGVSPVMPDSQKTEKISRYQDFDL